MPIDEKILEKLRQNDSGLTRLNLSSQKLTDSDIHILLQALVKNSTLTELCLGDNQIGNEGAKALAGNSTLTQLILDNNQIGDEGAKALARNSTLTDLHLYGNRIGNEGAKAFEWNNTLTRLSLRKNRIDDKGAKALAKNSTLAQLNLMDNQISAKGTKALAGGNSTLTKLFLGGNQISAEGVQALARNNTLTELNLVGSQIDDDGAKAFLENFTLTSLTIFHNNISDSLKEVIAAHIKVNQLRAELKLQREIEPGQRSTLTESSQANLRTSEKPSEVEADKLPIATLSLSASTKEDKATETVDTASPQSSFFKPLVDEEQAEKVRVYATGLLNAITDCLPVLVTINRGKYLEIQEQEEEGLDDLSCKALRLTLAGLFDDQLSLMPGNRYRIAWSFLSAGQSEQFASLYDAEYQCLLEESATKTSTFSEAETLKTAGFVDALDNDPSNKAKIAAALQTLIEEKLAINVGRKKGVSMSIQGLSEVLPEEQIKAQALIDSLKVLTIGNGASFSKDSITLPWESLRAKYVREFNATYEAQLMRLESAASRSFKH